MSGRRLAQMPAVVILSPIDDVSGSGVPFSLNVMLDKKHAAFPGRLVIVGFGSIGQGVLPLLLRRLEIAADRITIITAEPRGHDVAAEYGIRFIETALTRSNYRALLEPQLGKDDFLLNVSVDVSSVALIELCQERGALYLDTCIEPWPGGYADPNLPPSARTNYALRESAVALRARYPGVTNSAPLQQYRCCGQER